MGGMPGKLMGVVTGIPGMLGTAPTRTKQEEFRTILN